MATDAQIEALVKAICVFLLCGGVILYVRSSKDATTGLLGRIAGGAGCLIGSVCIIASYCMISSLYVAMVVSLFIYLPACGVLLMRGKTKAFRIIAALYFTAFLLLAGCATAVARKNFAEASLKHHFGQCAKALYPLETLQKEHYEEYGAYAGGLDQLYERARKLCPANEYYCNLSEQELKDACRSVSLSLAEDGGYKLEARTKDRTNCYIIITPEGINRWHHWECKSNKRIRDEENTDANRKH